MRHSRKAVMTERYKLYMKKHIFNGRYFVRNMQILICTIVVTALVIGGLVLGHIEPQEVATTNVAVDAKDSTLLGNGEEVKTVKEVPTTEAVEESIQEEVATEAVVAEVVAIEDKKEVEEQEEKSKFEDKCIADVEETLNVRKGPSTDTEFVGSMNPGAIATVLGVEGEWTKIKSGDVEGYVLSEFVKTGESAEELAEEYVTLRGTVLEDGVNIRSEKSTDADILVVLDKDDTITVLENPEEEDVVVEATTESAPEVEITEAVTEAAMNQDATTEEKDSAEDITWIPVMLSDGQTGYVSAELVDVDELYEIAVSAEELQRQAAEEAARKAAEEEAARQAAASQSSGSSTGSNSSSKDDSATYQGATTKPVTATESGECIGTFTITAYCGCKKCSGGKTTASGTTPTEGRTIAADTSILPYGTQVVIDGIVYTVEDCGSGVRGNHIDIFFATHEKAKAFGTKTVKVYKY